MTEFRLGSQCSVIKLVTNIHLQVLVFALKLQTGGVPIRTAGYSLLAPTFEFPEMLQELPILVAALLHCLSLHCLQTPPYP